MITRYNLQNCKNIIKFALIYIKSLLATLAAAICFGLKERKSQLRAYSPASGAPLAGSRAHTLHLHDFV